MKKRNITVNVYRILLISFSFLISNFSHSQIVISNQGATAATILSGFIGTGLAITNPVITCPSLAYGTFSGGTGIGVTNGVVLTTGNTVNLSSPQGTQMSTENGTTCNDAQLTSLEPLATNDCCILEFDVVPSCNQLTIRFVFGSEEYPEFVGGGFNDAFGFFVTGPNPAGGNYINKNIAIVTGTTICSINNVNDIDNSSFYVDNTGGTGLVFDGYTTAITSSLTVTPCQSYHFKLAIADAGDGGWDSGVLIDFLTCTNTLLATSTATAASCGVSNGTATATAVGGMGVLTYTWSPAPGGGQGTATATGLTGGVIYTCTVDDIYACILPVTTTITVPSSGTGPVVTNSPLTQSICSGGTTALVNLTADIAGSTFAWTATATSGITGFTASGTSTIPVQTLLNSGVTSGTVTYAITPTAAGCPGAVTNYVITVLPQVTPTFAAIANVCQNATAPVLPTSSTNIPAITGTWSPAVSTTVLGTTIYTFAPTAGQCAVTTTLNITVSTPVTPTFAAVGSPCQNATAPVLPTSSADAAPITGTWSPAVSTAALGTITYTFTPTAGQCATTTTLDITVSTPVTPTFSAIANVCQNATAPVLPTSSTNVPAITGTWLPAVSTATTGTTTFTFTPTAGVCAVSTTQTITVDTPVIPSFTAITNVCQNTIAPVLPTSSTNVSAISGTWSPVVSTAAAGTTTYTFTPTVGQCATTTTLPIIVDPQITPTFAAIANVCQNDTPPVLPTSSTNVSPITGTWSPAVSTATLGTITYTFTPAGGQCAINTTLNITVSTPVIPTFAAIANVCQNATAPVIPTSSTNVPPITGTWSPVVSTATLGTTTYTFTPTAGVCATITTLNITVSTPVTPTFTAIANVCQNATAPVLPLISTNMVTGTWSPVVSTAITGSTTYTFTPTAGVCAVSTTQILTVDTPVLPTFAAIANPCQNSIAPVIPTNSTNVPAISGSWSPAVSTAIAGTTTYTFTPTSGQCAINTSLDIIVDPQITPTFVAIADVCINASAPVLITLSTNGISGTWSPTVSTATVGTTTYTFTPTTGVCAVTTTLPITVLSLTTPLFAPHNPICVGSVVPVLQPLSDNIPPISGTWSPTVDISVPGTTTYTFISAGGQCASNTTLNIVVNPLPILLVTPPASVCSPEKVDLTLPAVTAGSTGTISYSTSPTGLTPLASPSAVSLSGTYFIVSENNFGCKVILPVVVEVNLAPLAAFIPTPSTLNVYNLTSTMVNNSIGGDSYEWFFMDGATSGASDPTHIFPDSIFGEQLITLIVTSVDGCKDTTQKVVIIDDELIFYVPNTFTPDGDTYNQTFQPIFTSGYDPFVFSMWIYNRWGEIVFETHDASKGWDGTYGEKGNIVQDGVYTWKIEFKSNKKDKHQLVTGSINILR